MIETSIIMTHYCEDPAREKIAIQCMEAMQPYRNASTEFILTCNGKYEGLEKYADKYFEREPADASPGRSMNIAYPHAEGNIIVSINNDILVFGDWLERCKELVLKYDKYCATPIYPLNRRWHERPEVDGYCVNDRVGSNCRVMTRKSHDEIGPDEEVNPMVDGSRYINRMLAKGYSCMMTKAIWAKDLGINIHSYKKQQEIMGYKKTRNDKHL